MLARLRVDGATSQAMTLPIQGVVTKEGKQYAYVVDKDNLVHRKAVKVGNLEGDTAIILAGLSLKDSVVVRGVDQVQEGKPVKPVPLSK